MATGVFKAGRTSEIAAQEASNKPVQLAELRIREQHDLETLSWISTTQNVVQLPIHLAMLKTAHEYSAK